MTNQEFIDQLIDATSKLLVHNGQKLYAAVRDQNYEEAARLKNKTQEIIDVAASAFNKNTVGGSVEFFKKHFNNQVKYIFDSLIEEYGEII